MSRFILFLQFYILITNSFPFILIQQIIIFANFLLKSQLLKITKQTRNVTQSRITSKTVKIARFKGNAAGRFIKVKRTLINQHCQ